MNYIDVFNGDADGICSLVQLRRAYPFESKLITGVKRDIKLLDRVDSSEANDAHITVLDISYEKNVEAVNHLLARGARIDYFDHHQTGKVAKHNRLNLNISLSADACTALIVDKLLDAKYRAWALVGAFGDNLNNKAIQLAMDSKLNNEQINQLKTLGNLVNYNSYGDAIDDLHYSPDVLFRLMSNYDDPFDFIAEHQDIFKDLLDGYNSDIKKAESISIINQTDTTRVYELPNEKWARRVSGVLSNNLTNQYPNQAIAVVRKKSDEQYVVSLRAPLNNKQGADKVASEFSTGGGRKAAAGINALPADMLGRFISTFDTFYT